MNPSKSKLTDEMKVEVVGGNKYAITFAPGAVDTIVADGTDQPALQGTTLAVTVEGPNNWRAVPKKEGGKSSRPFGHCPRTAKRSTTRSRATGPTVRH